MDFDNIVNGESVASAIGKINAAFGDALHKSLPDGYIHVGNSLNERDEVLLSSIDLPIMFQVFNTTGAILDKGVPLAIVGTHVDGTPLVDVALSHDNSKMPSIGLASTGIASGTYGLAQASSELKGLNTASYAVGTGLYVDGNGTLTDQRPTGISQIQKIGVVGKSDVDYGSILIQGAGRSNDLPNLQPNNFWFGDLDGTPKQLPVLNFSLDNTNYNTDFSCEFNKVYTSVDNVTNLIITLPSISQSDVGLVSKFWIKHNTNNASVSFTTSDDNTYINDVNSYPVAIINGNNPKFQEVTVHCIGLNNVLISHIDIYS